MLDQTVAKLELPPLSVPRARAMELLAHPDVKVRELAQVVESDPALTASVLRAANSALSAARTPIKTADDAIIRIGLDETRRIVTGAVVGDTFDGVAYAGIDSSQLWRHLVATAILADAATGTQRQSEAFTAGLLHDVGRLAMAVFDPDRYARVVEVARHGVGVAHSEFLLFGSEHTEWGARLAVKWNLSSDIVSAIAGHHDPPEGDRLATAVATGRRVAWAFGIGDGILTPTATMAEIDMADAALIDRAGGVAALLERVAWYCGAIQGATAADAA